MMVWVDVGRLLRMMGPVTNGRYKSMVIGPKRFVFNDKEEGNASLLCLFLQMLALFLLNWIESHTNQLGSLFYRIQSHIIMEFFLMN